MEKAILSNIKGNIMSTTSFDMQIKGMRKAQDFIVYPIAKNDSAKVITIQSDKRFGYLDLTTGKGTLSSNHPNGAYHPSYMVDKIQNRLVEFELSEVDTQSLRMRIFTSADSNAGESAVLSDNSGAINVLGEL